MYIGLNNLGLNSLSGKFSPRSLFINSEQGGWYDPSDLSTQFQDSAGTTPVTAAGQPVGKILDKSGRGNHIVQVTAAARPVLQQDASGWYWIGDAVDDFLVTPSNIDFTGTNKATAIYGIRKLADTVGIVAEFSSSSSTNLGSFTAYGSSNTGGAYGANINGTAELASVTPGNFTSPTSNVVSTRYDLAGASDALRLITRVNSVQQTLTFSSVFGAAAAFGNYPLYMFSRGGTTLFLNGRIYQTIIVNRALTALELTLAERYTGAKMGITL